MPRIETRRCVDCDTRYDVLWTRRRDGTEEPSALDCDDLDNLGCPKCGTADHERIIGTATGIDLGGSGGVGKHYPYYDRALGCMVESAQHRRRLMTHHPDGTEREFRLYPTEGDWDHERIVRDEERQAEEDERVYRETMQEMAHGPNREAYHRTLRSMGELLRRDEDGDLDKHMSKTGY